MKRMHVTLLLAGAMGVGGLAVHEAAAYDPYTTAGGAFPVPGGALPVPSQVPGKELSFDLDQTTPIPGPGVLAADPEQNLFWDGRAPKPGLTNSFDYSGSRFVPGGTVDQDRQVDALAARNDALFNALGEDFSHLLYSTAPVAGVKPILPAAPLFGPVRPDPEDVETELFGAPIHFTWAEHRVDINSDAADLAFNVDALEVWGLEPSPAGPDGSPGAGADSNFYSLRGDVFTPGAFSVWNYDETAGLSTGYITHGTIVAAVESLLGSDGLGEQIELDALMVNDFGEETLFEPGDKIYFSIEQIPVTFDPDGFYATGSELFTLEATAAGIIPGFLFHGGHVWDHAWTLDNMAYSDGDEGVYRQLDIDAMEAASVPEPTAAMLIGLGAAATLLRRRSA